MICPKCGGSDFKPVSETVVQSYQRCQNCGFAPAFDKMEAHDASEWMKALVLEHNALALDVMTYQAMVDESSKPTNLMIGNLNKSKRLLKENEEKMMVAEVASTLVEAFPQGQMTLHVPGLGLLLQFEWGGFELFKSLGTLKTDVDMKKSTRKK